MLLTLASSSEPPLLLSLPGARSQGLGLGLGGRPESGLSRARSALKLISSRSSSDTLRRFSLPTIAPNSSSSRAPTPGGTAWSYKYLQWSLKALPAAWGPAACRGSASVSPSFLFPAQSAETPQIKTFKQFQGDGNPLFALPFFTLSGAAEPPHYVALKHLQHSKLSSLKAPHCYKQAAR